MVLENKSTKENKRTRESERTRKNKRTRKSKRTKENKRTEENKGSVPDESFLIFTDEVSVTDVAAAEAGDSTIET